MANSDNSAALGSSLSQPRQPEDHQSDNQTTQTQTQEEELQEMPDTSQGDVRSKDVVAEEEETKTDSTAVDHLSHGLLERILPVVDSSKASLNELLRNQGTLLDTIQQENSKFSESRELRDVTEMMARAKHYHGKLMAIKKEISALREKTLKLKKRALKLQNQKMKENLQREHDKERELEHERQLLAKPIKKS